MKGELALLVDGDQVGAEGVATQLAELSHTWNVSARICIRNWRSTKDQAAWEAAARDCNLECIQHSPDKRGNNATDIELAIRAMDLFHGSGYRAFCILSADSDFLPLKRRLERGGGHVILRPLSVEGTPKTPAPVVAPAPKKASPPPPKPAPAPSKPAPPAKQGDPVAFGRALGKAYDECMAAGRHVNGAVRLVELGDHLPIGSKPSAFGYAKSWRLLRVVKTIPGYTLGKDAKGNDVVTRN